MDKDQIMTRAIAELDRCLALIEGVETGIAPLCLRMAKMELQVKLHNITDDELDAFREMMEVVGRKRASRPRKPLKVT